MVGIDLLLAKGNLEVAARGARASAVAKHRQALRCNGSPGQEGAGFWVWIWGESLHLHDALLGVERRYCRDDRLTGVGVDSDMAGW